MKGGAKRMEIDHRGRAWLALHAALIPHMKDPPRSVDDLLSGNRAEKQPQSVDAMIAAASAWHHATMTRN